MRARNDDPRKLDVERFATDAGRLQGQWPLVGMYRLVNACHTDAPPSAADHVDWQAAGERRGRGAGGSHAWLHLKVDAHVKLTCQRCLAAVEVPLHVERWFHFVAGEQQAAQLDAESEEDVLASTRSLDLHQLVEDELVLALPLVPRHEVCPQPLLPVGAETPVEDAAAPNPFAALAVLKRGVH
jgi:uncharacterized protein